HCK
ncbi:hypothetical protein ZOSMA_1802G00010, partial [Zostera marina]